MSTSSMFNLKKPPESVVSSSLVLNCTRGAPAPDGLQDDVRALTALPDIVKDDFSAVLLPYLAGEPTEAQRTHLQQLCERADLDPQQLVGPIRASRFLVASAAQTASSREAFSEDIARLDEDPRVIREAIGILLPIFEKVAPTIRSEIVERTVSEHGRLVEACHWRVDKIVNSEHGDGINVPVAVLTFDYREGSREDRITLQLLPEQLNALKQACLAMLPDPPPGAGGE